jgi:mono/diheme cytochrome c family protein
MRTLTAAVPAIVLGVTMATGATAFAAQGSADKGKQLFDAQKCGMCHSIGDKGNKKGPLDDVGTKLKADEIRQWLTDPAAMADKAKATRKPAMPSYKTKLTKDELDSVVAYLETLKK